MTEYIRAPLPNSLTEFAAGKSADAIELTGRAMPCTVVAVNGAIVTVKFEIHSEFTLPQVTCPVAESAYIRDPIQVGDHGYTVPGDYYLGGVSGLGGGVADLTPRGNLSCLVFHPLSNKAWAAGDPNAVQIKGVGASGAVIASGNANTTLTLNNAGVTIDIGGVITTFGGSAMTLTFGATVLTFNASGMTVVVGGMTATFSSSGLAINGGNITVNGTVVTVP